MPRRAIQQTDPSFVPSDVGERIRRAREERGLSLAQLAGTELTRGFISAVEHGRSSLSLKALTYLADRLELPVAHFLAGQESHSLLPVELELDGAEEQLQSQHAAMALERLVSLQPPSTLRARYLWLRGWALHDLGRAREAVPLLQEALNLTQQGSDLEQTSQVQYTLVRALYSATNYDEALEHLRELNSRAVELGDNALLGKITVALGHIYFVQGKRDLALAQYMRARELFQTVSDPVNLAAVYGGLSRLHRQQGDLQSAIKYARMGLGIWRSRQNQREAAHELANIAARYEELGESEMAMAAASEAVERAQESHSPDIEALARSSLAAAYLGQGKPREAREQAEAVQALPIDANDLGMIDATIVLAKVAEGEGDRQQADVLYGRALDALYHKARHGRYADVALAYSEALAARGNITGALEYAQRAAKALTGRPA